MTYESMCSYIDFNENSINTIYRFLSIDVFKIIKDTLESLSDDIDDLNNYDDDFICNLNAIIHETSGILVSFDLSKNDFSLLENIFVIFSNFDSKFNDCIDKTNFNILKGLLKSTKSLNDIVDLNVFLCKRLQFLLSTENNNVTLSKKYEQEYQDFLNNNDTYKV